MNMHSKYDSMHKNCMNYAFRYTNNHVITCYYSLGVNIHYVLQEILSIFEVLYETLS